MFLFAKHNPISGIQSVNKMVFILFKTHWVNMEWLCKLLEDFMGNDRKYLTKDPGGRLNKKDGLTRYGDSHVKYKTS